MEFEVGGYDKMENFLKTLNGIKFLFKEPLRHLKCAATWQNVEKTGLKYTPIFKHTGGCVTSTKHENAYFASCKSLRAN